MDLLFRLSKKIEGFEDIEEAKYFFKDILPKRDENHFYDTKKNQQIEAGEIIYFVYDGYIVAMGVFLGEIRENYERDQEYEKYFYGHKLADIQIVNSARRLNTKIVGTRTTYVDSDAKHEEINATLNVSNNNWTTHELEAAVIAYINMLKKEVNGELYTKKIYYTTLASKFGRSEKAYEYRMQNISYVYSLMGRKWLSGLKPAKNVGARVAGELEELINKIEGTNSIPVAEFESKVNILQQKKNKIQPSGNKKPRKLIAKVTQYIRDPEVAAWVLNEADGICENCNNKAPFFKEDATPFLEVHHLRRLADDGSDMISNAIAVCPNCHRELHYGINRDLALKALYSNIKRLIVE